MTSFASDPRPVRVLALPLYLLCAVLMVVPLWEFALSTGLSVHLGSVQWRVGMVGLLSGDLAMPVFAVVLAMFLTLTLEHRRGFQLLVLVSAIAALALIVVAGGFALDAVQLRRSVVPRARHTYDLSVLRAAGALAAYIVMTTATAVVGFRWARRWARTRQRARDRQQTLLIHKTGRASSAPPTANTEREPAPLAAPQAQHGERQERRPEFTAEGGTV